MAYKKKQAKSRQEQLNALYEILKTENNKKRREEILAQIFELEESINNQ